MKKITIVSGKGGTGKTSLAGCFASLAGEQAVLVDADVDAANLSLITRPRVLEEYEFWASKVAFINLDNCDDCGLCLELCRFEAISQNYLVDPVTCEGCGFCYHACPRGAIKMKSRLSGRWFVSRTPYGDLVHARLGIAEENSGKLVTTIRKKGEELAEAEKKKYLIVDGPPGIGCPVIASISGVDSALIVTEPTVSGIHDLERVLAVCRHFGVEPSVCINRYDLEEEQAHKIEEYCLSEKVILAGKIPFDRAFVRAMISGVPVVDFTDGAVSEKVCEVWDALS